MKVSIFKDFHTHLETHMCQNSAINQWLQKVHKVKSVIAVRSMILQTIVIACTFNSFSKRVTLTKVDVLMRTLITIMVVFLLVSSLCSPVLLVPLIFCDSAIILNNFKINTKSNLFNYEYTVRNFVVLLRSYHTKHTLCWSTSTPN